MNEVGVGIVGYGLAGRLFHRLLVQATPGLRIAAVCARSEARADQARTELPDAVVTPSFDELISLPGVDLVVLATPHNVHCAQTCAALAAGKAVVVDKIMACSVAEADAMIAASDRAGKLLSVFHNRRWDSDFLTVQDAFRRGLLGDVWSVDIAVARPGMPLRELGEGKNWRAQSAAFGGQLVDWGAHLMDQAALLAGSEPTQVFCDLQYRQTGNDNDTDGFVALRYRSGLRVTVHASVQTWLDCPHWQVHGSEGSLIIDGIDPQETVMRATDRVPTGADATISPAAVHYRGAHEAGDFGPVPGDWRAYYANVRDALRGEAELAVKPEQCRDALRVYERCFDAAGVVNPMTASRPTGVFSDRLSQ